MHNSAVADVHVNVWAIILTKKKRGSEKAGLK